MTAEGIGIVRLPNDCAYRELDLIERKTCRMRYDTVHIDYVCTNCGAFFQYPEYYDEIGDAVPFNYCPHCGAQVIEN
jgi:DNA-directed RNA polymerase subunit RPC12/RpoP